METPHELRSQRPSASLDQSRAKQIGSREPIVDRRASRVAHAMELMAVAAGKSYAKATAAAGRRAYHSVSTLVSHFNKAGMAALSPGHSGGHKNFYGDKEKHRIIDSYVASRIAKTMVPPFGRRPGRRSGAASDAGGLHVRDATERR